MPCSTGNPYFCGSCVPRGCSCNRDYFSDECLFKSVTASDILTRLIENKLKFRIEDRRINDEESQYLSHKYVTHLDEKGREFPCCEFWEVESKANWKLIAEF